LRRSEKWLEMLRWNRLRYETDADEHDDIGDQGDETSIHMTDLPVPGEK
jgi:hypothetical protein